MSTRGLWGFVAAEQEYLTYNHFDSYPDGLGLELLEWLGQQDLDALGSRLGRLRLVDEQRTPTRAERHALAPWSDGEVSRGDDWYALLRRTQGDPEATLKAGHMIDSRNFASDSLFCEWAYVIDLDQRRFEVYRGFQTARHRDGRFADQSSTSAHPSQDYYPIRRVFHWPLDQLPTPEAFLAAIAATT